MKKPKEAQTRKRLEARVSRDTHSLIKDAAMLTGQSLSQFIADAAIDRANAMVEKTCTVRLSEKAASEIAQALDEPPAPSEKLLKTARKFRDQDIR